MSLPPMKQSSIAQCLENESYAVYQKAVMERCGNAAYPGNYLLS